METVLFEYRHLQTMENAWKLYRHALRRGPWVVAVWGILTVLCLVMTVQCFLGGGSGAVGALYLVLTLLCVYRGFFSVPLRLRSSFKKRAAQQGTKQWEEILRFGEAIEITDGRNPPAKVEWSGCEGVEDQGDWLKLCFREHRLVLYMDAAAERLLIEKYRLPDIEVLVVGHHGSRYSTSEELLEAVRPEAAVVSVGSNHYGHPAAQTLRRLAEAGVRVYRTDLQGDIHFTVN